MHELTEDAARRLAAASRCAAVLLRAVFLGAIAAGTLRLGGRLAIVLLPTQHQKQGGDGEGDGGLEGPNGPEAEQLPMPAGGWHAATQ